MANWVTMPRSMPPCQDGSGVVNQLSHVSTPEAYGTRPAVDNAALDSTSDKTCGPGQQFLWKRQSMRHQALSQADLSQSWQVTFENVPKGRRRLRTGDGVITLTTWLIHVTDKRRIYRIKSTGQRTLPWTLWNPWCIFRTGLLHSSPSISLILSLIPFTKTLLQGKQGTVWIKDQDAWDDAGLQRSGTQNCFQFRPAYKHILAGFWKSPKPHQNWRHWWISVGWRLLLLFHNPLLPSGYHHLPFRS